MIVYLKEAGILQRNKRRITINGPLTPNLTAAGKVLTDGTITDPVTYRYVGETRGKIPIYERVE